MMSQKIREKRKRHYKELADRYGADITEEVLIEGNANADVLASKGRRKTKAEGLKRVSINIPENEKFCVKGMIKKGRHPIQQLLAFDHTNMREEIRERNREKRRETWMTYLKKEHKEAAEELTNKHVAVEMNRKIWKINDFEYIKEINTRRKLFGDRFFTKSKVLKQIERERAMLERNPERVRYYTEKYCNLDDDLCLCGEEVEEITHMSFYCERNRGFEIDKEIEDIMREAMILDNSDHLDKQKSGERDEVVNKTRMYKPMSVRKLEWRILAREEKEWRKEQREQKRQANNNNNNNNLHVRKPKEAVYVVSNESLQRVDFSYPEDDSTTFIGEIVTEYGVITNKFTRYCEKLGIKNKQIQWRVATAIAFAVWRHIAEVWKQRCTEVFARMRNVVTDVNEAD